MLKNALWLFGFTVVILIFFLPSYAKMQDLKARNNEYARRIDALQKRNTQLEKERYLLESDPIYLEKVARQRMGLIRDGEKVYRMVPAVNKKPKPKAQQ